MFVSASDNNVKSLVKRTWMFRKQGLVIVNGCIYNYDAKVMDIILYS